jgi:hypothetical protein
VDVLVVDDWAMTPLNESAARDFWEISEDRSQARSLVLTSQMPVARSHQQIGDSTIAEVILDRIIHRAHRIELRGESMRRNLLGHWATEVAAGSPGGQHLQYSGDLKDKFCEYTCESPAPPEHP